MDDLHGYAEYVIAINLWKYGSPILLTLGSIGNLITFIVLMQRKNRGSSTAMYLTALALSDILILWTGLFREWIRYLNGKDIRTYGEFGCRLHIFLTYLAFQCSSWFLVTVTVERLIAVLLPHKIKNICNHRNAGIVILVIVILFMFLNGHWFYGFTVVQAYQDHNSTYKASCRERHDHTYVAFRRIWNWIDLCIVSLVPLVLLSLANITIIIRLLMRKRKSKTQIVPSALKLHSRKKTVSQLTVTLIIVNIAFLVCSTPLSLDIILIDKLPDFRTEKHDYAVYMLRAAIVGLLAYLNSSINFILYFVSGSKFRDEVKHFCSRQRLREVLHYR